MPPNDSHAARLSVNRLPIELLQEIILLAAAPWDQRTTLRLSRVSRIWHTAVLGLPYLFTEADWYGWPVSRVEWWCERAGARPLTIRLYPRFNTVPWADNAVIARYAPQCGVFQLKPDDWLSRTVLHETTRALLTAQAPALRHLEISSSESTFISDTLDIYIDSDNMPNLCVLRTRGVIPHISKPLAGVTEMEYFITGLKAWDAWTKALTKLPNLKHLNLSFNPDDYGFHEGLRTALPSLEILVLSGIHYHNMSNVRSFFACAELPKLRLISLFNIGCKDACRGTIELLGRCAPELRQLTLSGYNRLYLLSPALQALNGSPILPQLEEVRLLYHANYTPPDPGPSYHGDLRILVQRRKGKLKRLSIPAFENGGLLDFLNDNLSHLELHSPCEPCSHKYYEGLS